MNYTILCAQNNSRIHTFLSDYVMKKDEFRHSVRNIANAPMTLVIAKKTRKNGE